MGAQARQARTVQPAAARPGDTDFAVQLGDLSVLPRVRYVITLDSDTQLPPGAAVRMIGAMAHPLNRPRIDPAIRRVREGYGVLQPRVDVSLRSASRTMFARTMAGHVGLDPYTTAASDVYQDLFHEGSYRRQGHLRRRRLQRALGGRVRENTLLSHDLFEGFFARAGLATDIHLVDDFPTHYLAWASRLHRWVRGDWQLVGWLLPTGRPTPKAGTEPAAGAGDAGRSLDNLRRSLLVAVAGRAAGARLDAASRVGVDVDAARVAGARVPRVSRPGRVARTAHPRRLAPAAPAARTIGPAGQRTSGAVDDGIPARSGAADGWTPSRRTLWRLLVSRKRLLQWESASDAAMRIRTDARYVWTRLVGSTDRRSRHGDPRLAVAPRAAAGRAAHPDLLGARADRGVSDWPPPPAAGRMAGGSRPVAAAAGWPADVALLRSARHRRPALADSRQHPGRSARARSRRVHRPPTSGCSCFGTLAAYDLGYLTTRGLVERRRPHPRRRCRSCPAITVTSTTGTTPQT